jgi:hypothetical protein
MTGTEGAVLVLATILAGTVLALDGDGVLHPVTTTAMMLPAIVAAAAAVLHIAGIVPWPRPGRGRYHPTAGLPGPAGLGVPKWAAMTRLITIMLLCAVVALAADLALAGRHAHTPPVGGW